ncbi:MAG TPA: hypothetical protein VGS12_17425 [Caulobacteraceae bacterium]|nr:hypothetical protein [Caulobacteraceae bacterium]
MAEHTFEMRLDRLFAESPAFADADLFAAALEARLNRGWTTRRLLIGGLGLVGGIIGAAQVLSSGLTERLAAALRAAHPIVSNQVASIALAHFLPEGFPVNGEIFWMSAAMAVAAVGLAIVRFVREI